MPDLWGQESMQMKLRCREGDVAVIVREEPGCEANIGRLVRVQGPIRVDDHQGPTWLIDTLDSSAYLCLLRGGVIAETLTSRLAIEHPDAWLQPIQAPPDRADDVEATAPVLKATCELDH
jgi:hypothetical protein